MCRSANSFALFKEDDLNALSGSKEEKKPMAFETRIVKMSDFMNAL